MLTQLLSRTETTAQRYLWLYRRAVMKGIQIVSPSFIYILKDKSTIGNTAIHIKPFQKKKKRRNRIFVLPFTGYVWFGGMGRS